MRPELWVIEFRRSSGAWSRRPEPDPTNRNDAASILRMLRRLNPYVQYRLALTPGFR